MNISSSPSLPIYPILSLLKLHNITLSCYSNKVGIILMKWITLMLLNAGNTEIAIMSEGWYVPVCVAFVKMMISKCKSL